MLMLLELVLELLLELLLLLLYVFIHVLIRGREAPTCNYVIDTYTSVFNHHVSQLEFVLENLQKP